MPVQGMGWVSFQGGDPEFPVWTSGIGGGEGGGTVTDTLWVGPGAPPDPSIEMWWDTDEPPQGGGGEEVYIGAEPPGAGYELWFDTDAEAPLTIDQRWNTAWGVVASGSMVVGNPLPLTAGALTLVTSNINFTMLTGRRYRIVMAIRAMRSLSTETYMSVLLRDGTTRLFATDLIHRVPASSQYTDFHYEWNFTGGGVARVYNAAITPTGVNCEIYTDTQAAFYIEDVGPTTLVPAPPPPDWTMYDARYVNVEELAPAWTPLPLATNWSNYSTPGYIAAGYRKIGDIVYLRGLIKSTAATVPTLIATLPVGYRPTALIVFHGWVSWNGAAGRGVMRINANGDGTLTTGVGLDQPTYGPAPTVWDHLSLDNVFFSVTP